MLIFYVDQLVCSCVSAKTESVKCRLSVKISHYRVVIMYCIIIAINNNCQTLPQISVSIIYILTNTIFPQNLATLQNSAVLEMSPYVSAASSQ